MSRANGEITVTYEALEKALGLDERIAIVGQATEPGDVRTGRVRLLVIDPEAPPVPEGAVSVLLRRIDSYEVSE